MLDESTPTPLAAITEHPGLGDSIRLFIKRDDLVHPLIQGNKWRKMHLLLSRLQQESCKGVVSFGGPFSNHIHALALAGPLFGLKTAAILRGTAADINNPSLTDAREQGMDLFAVSKKDYDLKGASPVVQAILDQLEGYFQLPEGGATQEGIEGCAAISREILEQTTDRNGPLNIAVPAGTGCTAAGIIQGAKGQAKVLVFPAAAYGISADSIEALLLTNGYPAPAPFDCIPDYVMGKFARPHPDIWQFAHQFTATTGIELDPFYTSRMLYGLFDLLQKKQFPPHATIVAVHTGGLQAWRGIV